MLTSLILELRHPEMSSKVVQGGFEIDCSLILKIKSVLKSCFKINVSYRLQHIVWTCLYQWNCKKCNCSNSLLVISLGSAPLLLAMITARDASQE